MAKRRGRANWLVIEHRVFGRTLWAAVRQRVLIPVVYASKTPRLPVHAPQYPLFKDPGVDCGARDRRMRRVLGA